MIGSAKWRGGFLTVAETGPGIELFYSNKTERLLDKLAGSLRERKLAGADPLEPVELVVPNRNMETWVRLGLAQSTGIAANLNFRRVERFFGDIAAQASHNSLRLADLDTVEAAILAVLIDEKMMLEPNLAPVHYYLHSVENADPEKPLPSGMEKVLPGTMGEQNPGLLNRSVFDAYLLPDGKAIRQVQLASRMAYLFQEYSLSRPEMIARWRDRGNNPSMKTAESGAGLKRALPFSDPAAADPSAASVANWQQALWQLVFGPHGVLDKNPPPGGGRWETLDLLALDNNLFKSLAANKLPPLYIFGVSYMARLFQVLFARLGEVLPLKIYTLNPCAEFWEDVETDRELFSRLEGEKEKFSRRSWKNGNEPESEDPFSLAETDNPGLRYWGRPGREHMKLLGELTDCDFHSAFEDPFLTGKTLLQILQRDILLREPERIIKTCNDAHNKEIANTLTRETVDPLPPDPSLQIIAAPSVRREVEWVADEIWRLMRDDKSGREKSPLRFNDIAIIVNSSQRDLYLPQIETAFSANHNLPCSISDLPGSASSGLIEAMSLLLKLPFGRFSRTELLSLLEHPALLGNFKEIAPGEQTRLADKLGIIFGADKGDHVNTYIDEDVFNWDQGIKRLALGAFMTGAKSGDNRYFAAASSRLLPAETPETELKGAAWFGLLIRSLIADSRYVRTEQLTLSDWADFYARQLDTYLCSPENPARRERLRLLSALSRLDRMDLGKPVSGRAAAELALRSLESLEGARGQYLAEGVVVSSFLPMRAIPFRNVFILGLGEGQFPAPGRRDALDLRSARRRSGDVDPSERDRYMFLETLLCSRDRLYISYVRRDEQTGDTLQPSAVVQELLHMLKTGYLGEEGIKKITLKPPLRRYLEPSVFTESINDEAKREAQVYSIATTLQDRLEKDEAKSIKPLQNNIPANIAINDLLNQLPDRETRDKLARMLALPAGISGSTDPKVFPLLERAPDKEHAAPHNLTISSIRRFLECPMQGWASSVLGLSEDEEDLFDREEEDFELDKPLETGLLRSVFLDALSGNINPFRLYRERSERLRLEGRLPVGSLGQALERKHRSIFEEWAALLKLSLPDQNQEPWDLSTGQLFSKRFRLGRSADQSPAEIILDPLNVKLNLTDEPGHVSTVSARVSGLTGNMLSEAPIFIILQPGKPPQPNTDSARSRIFRTMLRGLVDLYTLASAGEISNGSAEISLLYASGRGEAAEFRLSCRVPSMDDATAWITERAAELLGPAHDYLLPCEAIFLEHLKRAGEREEGVKKKGVKKIFFNPEKKAAGPNGDALRSLVYSMAADERWFFSSTWGPVPDPRHYEPPPAQEASAIAEKRFGLLFKNITALEGF